MILIHPLTVSTATHERPENTNWFKFFSQRGGNSYIRYPLLDSENGAWSIGQGSETEIGAVKEQYRRKAGIQGKKRE